MMRPRRKVRRLMLIGLGLAILSLASALVFVALNDSVTFFKTPSEITGSRPLPAERLRLGGLVKEGSVSRGADAQVSFEVTDGAAAVPVRFTGLLPDLFREGQGVVTEGIVNADGIFMADTVLAKHDESYMPREVADSLKAQGLWKPGENGQPAE